MLSPGEGPWLARRAAASPEREALLEAGGPVPYAELHAAVEGRVRALHAAGVGEGARVGLWMTAGRACLELVHALSACGALLVPLNRRLRPGELAFQLEDAALRFVVHGPEDPGEVLAEAREAVGDPPAALPVEALADGPAAAALPGFDPERPLALLYTSGTTGAPRGAILSHRSFEANARASAIHLGVDARDRWLACMPLYHVGGLSIAVRSTLAGTSIVVHERFDPARVSEALDRDRITLASFVATMLRRVLAVRGDRPPPECLRAALLGGGPTPEPLLRRALEAGWPVLPTYGLTEAASQVATRRPGDRAEPLDGRLEPLPGTALRIAGPDGEPLPAGRVGEIQVQGPSLMSGYAGRSEPRGPDPFRDGWLATGDLGRLDEEGRLQVLDRRRDLLVSGGENVYPAEVEAVLEAHTGVVEAGVAALPDPDLGARPGAWVVPRPGSPLARLGPAEIEGVLRAHCRERLAGYKVPVRVEVRSALPRTATGKLRRDRLCGGAEEAETLP